MGRPRVDESAPATAAGADSSRRGPRVPVRWLLTIAIALVLTALVRTFVAQTFVVPTGSMQPSLHPGDRIVVARWVDGQDLHRGDVVVFDGTDTFGPGPGAVAPVEPEGTIAKVVRGAADLASVRLGRTDYVKRVIGLPGDRVACRDRRVVVNGTPLEEPYLSEGVEPCDTPFDVQVPDGRMFVLGDNRPGSADSRSHLGDPGGGMVPLDDVLGRVTVRYWPASRAGSLAE
ncbi:signal peptidase I [Janibacter massiliensis]|uniref:signal peptidase I n=1 Tax=Janibacter massiliensis TaxID=2058291 RepID=UPI000D0F50FD|nr:signal peptidase I [Janibacter massiliensis]